MREGGSEWDRVTALSGCRRPQIFRARAQADVLRYLAAIKRGLLTPGPDPRGGDVPGPLEGAQPGAVHVDRDGYPVGDVKGTGGAGGTSKQRYEFW